MKSGKHMKKKPVIGMAMVLALTLLIGCGIGGTVAWLMDSTTPVTNTFTVGKVDIDLNEHGYDPDNDNKVTATNQNTNDYPLIPGTSYGKDPKVTVAADSEACYLFVRIQEINNPSAYLDYSYNLNGWQLVEDDLNGDKVYYRTVTKGTGTDGWYLLNGDTTHTNGVVTVKEGVIDANRTPGEGEIQMPADSAKPQIIFTAYAVQTANLTMAEAWAEVDPTPAANP